MTRLHERQEAARALAAARLLALPPERSHRALVRLIRDQDRQLARVALASGFAMFLVGVLLGGVVGLVMA